MEWDLGLEGRVHIQLAGVYHRVFWWTQEKIEGHIDGIGRSLKRCMGFLVWEGEEEGGSIRLFPNI